MLVVSCAPAMAKAPAASATIELGAYTPGAPGEARALSDYAAMVGRKPSIVMWYRDFGQPLLYPVEAANLRATGQVPMVTWEPHDQPLAAIASGAYDSYLRESAQIAKAWGGTLMIRFAHEMNGNWDPWDGSPQAYVDAWRHVVSVFRAAGADNVRWVWAPNVQAGDKYPIAPYFPGDAWIDYVGLDGYNWGAKSGSAWRSLYEIFAGSYSIVTQLSTKPVMLTETASSETGGDKGAWIRSGFMSAIPQSFPRVSAVIWFNADKEADWRVNSSPGSLDAYRAVVACSIYGGSGPCDPGVGEAPVGGQVAVSKLRVTRVVTMSHRRLLGTVSYRLTRRARVRIVIQRRTRRRFVRQVVVRRSSSRGRTRLPLQGVVRRHRLRRGRYRIVVVASDGRGHRSHPRRARFRVAR